MVCWSVNAELKISDHYEKSGQMTYIENNTVLLRFGNVSLH